jgi:hypothetical protein
MEQPVQRIVDARSTNNASGSGVPGCGCSMPLAIASSMAARSGVSNTSRMGHWARNFSPSESSVSMVAAKCEMDWDWLARLTYFDRYAVVLEAFNPSGIRCSAPDQTHDKPKADQHQHAGQDGEQKAIGNAGRQVATD